MNITADPGLLYNMSELFTIVVVYSLKNELQQIYIKYNKTKHLCIWSRNPSILSLKRKDDKFIIFVL